MCNQSFVCAVLELFIVDISYKLIIKTTRIGKQNHLELAKVQVTGLIDKSGNFSFNKG